MKAQNAKYYKVSLVGVRGTYIILNYYSPNGLIKMSSNMVSRYAGGSYASLYVTPHNVYIADRFETPLYVDNTKMISMVSVAYGNRVVIGADLKFN